MKTLVLSLFVIALCSCAHTGKDAIDKNQLANAVQTAKEHARPQQYIEVSSTWKENLIGRKVFNGSIYNKAQHTTFEKMQLTFHFFDSLNVKIGERSFMCKDALAPGKTYKFKIKTYAPLPTKTYTCTVASGVQK